MEFWGVEVKPHQTFKCELGGEKYLHLSMSALGESKKAGENAVVYVTFNSQKLVIGTLSTEKCAQISHDLVFENDFELSHSAKNASVYFTGYKSFEEEEDFDGFNFSDDEEDALAGKPSKVKITTADEDDSDDDSSDEDVKKKKLQTLEEDSDEDESSEEEDEEDESDDSEEEENSEEEEETPEAANGKKRPAEAAAKTASPVKKAKLETPADGKKAQSSGKAKKSAPAKGKDQTNAKAKGKGGAK